jgi:glycosyltransferase involved in cell wall biosynthesis
MLALAWEGITSLSIQPIRIITWLGLIIFLISIVMVIYSLISFFVGAAVSGWASTLCSIWALGGLQLLAIGILGEYIGRIYDEVKQRPLYIEDKKK